MIDGRVISQREAVHKTPPLRVGAVRPASQAQVGAPIYSWCGNRGQPETAPTEAARKVVIFDRDNSPQMLSGRLALD
jgi:hypothetical protein